MARASFRRPKAPASGSPARASARAPGRPSVARRKPFKFNGLRLRASERRAFFVVRLNRLTIWHDQQLAGRDTDDTIATFPGNERGLIQPPTKFETFWSLR